VSRLVDRHVLPPAWGAALLGLMHTAARGDIICVPSRTVAQIAHKLARRMRGEAHGLVFEHRERLVGELAP